MSLSRVQRAKPRIARRVGYDGAAPRFFASAEVGCLQFCRHAQAARIHPPTARGRPRPTAGVLVFLADADADRGRLIEGYLRAEGHAVEWVRSGCAALEHSRHAALDLLIMATRLPGLAGLDVCRQVRSESALPIVLLAPADNVGEGITGLELGADSYLTQPISPRELGARVRAIFRRALHSPFAPSAEELVLGDLRVRPMQFNATLRGRPLVLRPQEYRLLLALARHPGVVLSRERLLELGWHRTSNGATNGATVGVHLAWLRRKLQGSDVRIENVRRRGYRLVVGAEFTPPD
jgi:DNA-binding response OmpR family regulator